MATTLKTRWFRRATPKAGAPKAGPPNSGTRLSGRNLLWLMGATGLAILLGSGLAARWFLLHYSASHDGIETQVVQKGRLMVTIASEGNLASANNAELKCQVAGGARIISIVPDGTQVAAGTELVQLDRSSFDQQLDAEKIIYERAIATQIQAEQDYQAAEIAVREYLEGSYHKDLQAAKEQIIVAQQNLDVDKNVLSHTERMYRKGFVTALQLEADKFAVEHAQLDLDAATLAKKVLEEFTRPKTLKQLESVRDAADARRHAEQASVNLEKTKLDRIQQQLKFCVIKAPQRGMVVYANDPDRRSSSDSPQIEEGAMARERQTIIRLPDLGNMQVETTVHESHVPHIRPGMPARIGILDRTWKGHVKSIASRPAPPPRYSTPTKNYSVFISIEGDLSGLRPGMTAQVEILLADLHDVCAVPVAAVVQQQEQYYAWVKEPNGPHKRKVTIGTTDDKIIEIKSGLVAGDNVITNPRATVPETMHFEDSGRQASEDDSRFRSKVQAAEPAKSQSDAQPVSQRDS
jgi:RND family efflux transporter MFP subunit